MMLIQLAATSQPSTDSNAFPWWNSALVAAVVSVLVSVLSNWLLEYWRHRRLRSRIAVRIGREKNKIILTGTRTGQTSVTIDQASFLLDRRVLLVDEPAGFSQLNYYVSGGPFPWRFPEHGTKREHDLNCKKLVVWIAKQIGKPVAETKGYVRVILHATTGEEFVSNELLIDGQAEYADH